jgi:hypothetical protein
MAAYQYLYVRLRVPPADHRGLWEVYQWHRARGTLDEFFGQFPPIREFGARKRQIFIDYSLLNDSEINMV